MSHQTPLPTPVILEVALNGMTAKEQNPNVPRTSSEIVADALQVIDGLGILVGPAGLEPATNGL